MLGWYRRSLLFLDVAWSPTRGSLSNPKCAQWLARPTFCICERITISSPIPRSRTTPASRCRCRRLGPYSYPPTRAIRLEVSRCDQPPKRGGPAPSRRAWQEHSCRNPLVSKSPHRPSIQTTSFGLAPRATLRPISLVRSQTEHARLRRSRRGERKSDRRPGPTCARSRAVRELYLAQLAKIEFEKRRWLRLSTDLQSETGLLIPSRVGHQSKLARLKPTRHSAASRKQSGGVPCTVF
jgi:hypothetical protein